MINFRFCDSNHKGDVPLYKFNEFDEFETFIDFLFKHKQDGTKVYVCFNPSREEDIEFPVFVITCNPYYEIAASEMVRLNNLYDNHKFDYTIFEYNTYNEAFDFCKDLTQGEPLKTKK